MEKEFSWEIKAFKIEDVLTLIKEKKLNLRPEYQRRSVWSYEGKSSLIETVFQKKPIPFFLIYEKKDGIFDVVDGQQRLRAIYDFYNNEYEMKGKNIDEKFKSLKYESILKDSLFPEIELLTIFNNYQLYFTIIKNATEDEIIDMYSRVNKYTVNLNKMELKYALTHDTDFIKLIEELSDEEETVEFFLKSGIFTQKSVDRMSDIEFFALLIIFILEKDFSNKDEAVSIEVFSKYSDMDAKQIDYVRKEFKDTLLVIQKLFFGEEFQNYFELDRSEDVEFYIKNSRFKQKNDFLSLFCTLNVVKEKINFTIFESEIKNFLILMDYIIAPQSDIKIAALYGTKCVSQANTKTSREFRSKFILEGLNYIIKEDLYTEFQFTKNESLDLINNLFNQINELYELIGEKQFKVEDNPSFKRILETIWEQDEAEED